jgi:hypothetical protein
MCNYSLAVNKHSVAREEGIRHAMSSVGTLKSVKRMPAPKTLPKIASGDFTRDLDISQDELLALLDLTQQLKSEPSRFAQALAGRYHHFAV